MDAVNDPVYGANWYATAAGAQGLPRRTLTRDIDVDVCVVGGGLAGLTTARELARRGWSVALLEARRIAWNASGRNAGFVLPGFNQARERIVERVGRDQAREIWLLAEEGMNYVRRAIRTDRIRAADPKPGWLEVEAVEAGAELAQQAEELNTVYGTRAEFWPTDQVRAALNSRRYHQAIYYPRAFHIDPLAYASGLAAAAEAAGAAIYEQTPAVAIDFDGIRKRVTTPQGRVRAEHIVLAGGTHMSGVLPSLEATLRPIWSYVVVTEPLGAALAEAVRFSGAVSEAEGSNHYRIVDGDRLLWCARITTWERNASRFAAKLQGEIARTFPQIGRPPIAHAWSGVFGNTIHRMPQIGCLRPGVWVANGFSGHGLNTSAMAGNLIAAGIAARDDRWRLFVPFELIWAGGRAGQAATQAYIWSRRFRARVARPVLAMFRAAPAADDHEVAGDPQDTSIAAAEAALSGGSGRNRRGRKATPAALNDSVNPAVADGPV